MQVQVQSRRPERVIVLSTYPEIITILATISLPILMPAVLERPLVCRQERGSELGKEIPAGSCLVLSSGPL